MSMYSDDDIQRYQPPKKLIKSKQETEEIINYLQGAEDATLSIPLQDKLKRLEQCAELTRTYISRHKVVPMMMKLYDYDISTAYRDFNDAQEIFSAALVHNKHFMLDMLLGMMRTTWEKCQAGDKKDFRTAAAIEKNMGEIITTHYGDKDAELYKKLQFPQIIVTTDPSILNTQLPENWREEMQKLLSTGPKINPNNIPETPFDDAD